MKKIIAIIMLLLSFLSQVPAMGMEFSPDKPIHKGILPAVDLTTMPAETVHSMYCTNPGCPSKFATKDELSEHLKECPLDPKSFEPLAARTQAILDFKGTLTVAANAPFRSQLFDAEKRVWTDAELRATIDSQPYNLDETQEKERDRYYELLTSLASQSAPFHCPCSHNAPPCQYQQVHKRDIKKHIQQSHTHYRPYWCPICGVGKRFTLRERIRTHMQSAHNEEKRALKGNTTRNMFDKVEPYGPDRRRSRIKRKK